LLQPDVLTIGLTAPFSYLYQRIDRRVEARVKQGIINEIKGLLAKGYSWHLPAMKTMGYKEWKEHFSLHFSLSTFHSAVQSWKFDEHAYARRQMTWFRKMKQLHWFDITRVGYAREVEENVRKWYTS
jgi:tRNA dimethylallyltransferase